MSRPGVVGGGGVLDDDLACPATVSVRPADRAEAKSRSSSTGNVALGEHGAHDAADLAGGAEDADVHGARLPAVAHPSRGPQSIVEAGRERLSSPKAAWSA